MRPIRTCTWPEGCESMCEGNTDFCGTHNAMQRKAERQAKKFSIVKPTNKVSEKRAGQMSEYTKLRREYLTLYPMCEVEDCTMRSCDIHHQRGKEGDRLLDTNYFMAVCREHHVYYTEHSKEAIEKGISKPRTV